LIESNCVQFGTVLSSPAQLFPSPAGPRAHAQPTRAASFPYFHVPRHRPAPTIATVRTPLAARPPSPTPSSSAWRDRAHSAYSLLPSRGVACAGPLPFSLLLSVKSRRCPLPLPFILQPRSAPRLTSTFLPLSAKPVHRSRAPKRRHPCRIHTEAPPPFPSSVSSAPTFLFRFWLGPNACIPP
jgi:hypothetical protein